MKIMYLNSKFCQELQSLKKKNQLYQRDGNLETQFLKNGIKLYLIIEISIKIIKFEQEDGYDRFNELMF